MTKKQTLWMVACTLFVMSLSWWLGWLLNAIEITAAALVAFGCLGEMWLLIKQPPSEEDILIRFEKKKHFWERLFVCMVAAGVTIELILLPINIKEAEELKASNLKLKKQVEELTKANLELKAEFAWRTLTPAQKNEFHAFVSQRPTGTIWVSFVASDPESFLYAKDFQDLLKTNGFSVNDFLIPISTISSGGPKMGVFIQTRDKTKPPAIAIFLQKALETIGITAPGENGSESLKDDEIWLDVALRPRPEPKK